MHRVKSKTGGHNKNEKDVGKSEDDVCGIGEVHQGMMAIDERYDLELRRFGKEADKAEVGVFG
jgi:hypothetical protein